MNFDIDDGMPTNKPTLKALGRLSHLIDRLDTRPTQSLVDEIKAWNRLLKRHKGQQKRQNGKWKNDKYEYDKNTKKIKRITKEGDVISYY